MVNSVFYANIKHVSILCGFKHGSTNVVQTIAGLNKTRDIHKTRLKHLFQLYNEEDYIDSLKSPFKPIIIFIRKPDKSLLSAIIEDLTTNLATIKPGLNKNSFFKEKNNLKLAQEILPVLLSKQMVHIHHLYLYQIHCTLLRLSNLVNFDIDRVHILDLDNYDKSYYDLLVSNNIFCKPGNWINPTDKSVLTNFKRVYKKLLKHNSILRHRLESETIIYDIIYKDYKHLMFSPQRFYPNLQLEINHQQNNSKLI